MAWMTPIQNWEKLVINHNYDNVVIFITSFRMAPTPCPHPELYKNPRLLPPAAAAPAQAEWREWVFLILLHHNLHPHQVRGRMGLGHCQHLCHLPCQQDHVQVENLFDVSAKSVRLWKRCWIYLSLTKFRQQLHGISALSAFKQLRSEVLVSITSFVISKIFQGLLNLYRGILPPLLQKSASTALMFGSYEQYRRLLLEQVENNSQFDDFTSFEMIWGGNYYCVRGAFKIKKWEKLVFWTNRRTPPPPRKLVHLKVKKNFDVYFAF